MSTNPQKRAALYVRVSTNNRADGNQAVFEQNADLQEFPLRQGRARFFPLFPRSIIRTMDYSAVIRALRWHMAQIDQAIADLESLNSRDGTQTALLDGLKVLKRRGRKSMPAEERRQVSERMKSYWAARRKRKP